MKKETLAKAKELEEDIRLVKYATTYFRNQRWSHWDLNDSADTFHFEFCKNYSEKSSDCVHLPRWMNSKLMQVLYAELNRMEQELEELGDADTGGATQKENEIPHNEWQPVYQYKEGDYVVLQNKPQRRSLNRKFTRFLENAIVFLLYAAIFCLLLGIALPTLSTREYVGYSLILGFFAGLLNNIERVMRELFKKED